MMNYLKKSEVRLHLTNVVGLGATMMAQSLLPALESNDSTYISKIYLPDHGPLSKYKPLSSSVKLTHYKRMLPNVFSRFFECCLMGRLFEEEAPLLVLGDIPIAGVSNQVVFLQTSLFLRNFNTVSFFKNFKYIILSFIFRVNLRYVKSIVVQTNVMGKALLKKFPELSGKVHVIPQPVPKWLMESKLHRKSRYCSKQDGLTLFYPAAPYPHKNHKILSQLQSFFDQHSPVRRLILTVPPSSNPVPNIEWVDCVGRLSEVLMIDLYRQVDALLFLSLEESFGFPLIEAMFVGIPIICPDLPYAREICGVQAEYFDPSDPASLEDAISRMSDKIKKGWWPNWSKELSMIPVSWKVVAARLMDLASRSCDE